jgi:hypothetical protein
MTRSRLVPYSVPEATERREGVKPEYPQLIPGEIK